MLQPLVVRAHGGSNACSNFEATRRHVGIQGRLNIAPTATSTVRSAMPQAEPVAAVPTDAALIAAWQGGDRSEEHTSELHSRPHLVCRLLLDKIEGRSPDRQLRGHASALAGRVDET